MLLFMISYRIQAQSSFCNPLDLNYRFRIEEPSRREAADPTAMFFKDRFYIFASKSGGYWNSKDLLNWDFIQTNDIPTEEYAPTTIAIGDTVYFLASDLWKSTIYKSTDLLSGKWEVAIDSLESAVWDPAFYLDDDNRLYLYWGCSNGRPIYGVEIDYNNDFTFMGKPKELIYSNDEENGWERYDEYNNFSRNGSRRKKPYIEGAWMNKHDGKYYLQYSAPATEYKSYNDGVYVSDSPLGTFQMATHNPFSYKPEGFIAGAGHGSTFQDTYGNYWHIATMSVSVKDRYERRLGLFPAFFDQDGLLYANTAYGDFPHKMPKQKLNGAEDYQPEWMLLSYNKPVEVSSELYGHPKENAINEDIRTYWCAQTGDKGEWLLVDLNDKCRVSAIQINFAEEDCSILGIQDSIFYQYVVEYSTDKKKWTTLIDRTSNIQDSPHDYTELQTPVSARYIKITNYRVPEGKFALSGLRIFGKGKGKSPEFASNLSVERDTSETRNVKLTWDKTTEAIGYTIRYGEQPNKLYQSYQVLDTNALTIYSLNKFQDYYFTIDAFNENGISEGKIVKESIIKK